MRRKSSGVVVLAVLAGIAVAAVVYIASFGKSGHLAEIAPQKGQGQAMAESTASDAAFAIAPLHAASAADATTAAR